MELISEKNHIFTPSTLEHSRKYRSTKTHISLTIREILSHIMILLENPTVYSKGNDSEAGKYRFSIVIIRKEFCFHRPPGRVSGIVFSKLLYLKKEKTMNR